MLIMKIITTTLQSVNTEDTFSSSLICDEVLPKDFLADELPVVLKGPAVTRKTANFISESKILQGASVKKKKRKLPDIHEIPCHVKQQLCETRDFYRNNFKVDDANWELSKQRLASNQSFEWFEMNTKKMSVNRYRNRFLESIKKSSYDKLAVPRPPECKTPTYVVVEDETSLEYVEELQFEENSEDRDPESWKSFLNEMNT